MSNILKKLTAEKRKELYKKLPKSLVFLSSPKEAQRNGDVTYPYRQSSDLWFLSGVNRPGYSILLDTTQKKSYMFIPDLNIMHQIWEGRQQTAAEAKKEFGFDRVYYQKDFHKVFQQIAKNKKKLHTLDENKKALNGFKKSKSVETKNLRQTCDELRVIKSKYEVQLMQKANDITSVAHETAMRLTKPGMKENEIQALIESIFVAQGSNGWAYPSIVAAGKNASILHYRENNCVCKSGDLLLIDAGCEYEGYAADVTRTFPINGKFTKKQKQVYEIVLETQKSCIKLAKPGVGMLDLFKHSAAMISEGLMDLGFFKTKDLLDIMENQVYRYFYPHSLGHMLGIDVHDVGAYEPQKNKRPKKTKMRTNRILQPGMSVTIEPGVYFIEAYLKNKDLRKGSEKFINWSKVKEYSTVGGIRIEDDIIITQRGNKDLTKVAKEVSDIEKLMAS